LHILRNELARAGVTVSIATHCPRHSPIRRDDHGAEVYFTLSREALRLGYPACPNLEGKLLRPEEIGVQLTEGFMMDPEASVSALVSHHPDCTYFSVGEATPEA
jgi:hypothetical protein